MIARLCGVALALACVAAPAHAGDDVGLSRDGVRWSASLSGSLFDPARRWVPGDRETSAFYIRNQGATGARLTVEVRAAESDELLGQSDINLSVRAGSGPWVELHNGVPSPPLTARAITSGDRARLELRALFDPASTNHSQSQSVSLQFRVTLAEGVAANPDGSGFLPGIGSFVTPWMLWLIAALIGIGVALRRRRRAEVAHA